MFNFTKCPNCGNPIDITEGDETITTCPKCGAKISFSRSSQDVMSLDLAGMGNMQDIIQNASQFKKVKELVLSGNKIEAIKLYRELTNVGLKEAKDAVDAMEAGQPVVVTQTSFASTTHPMNEEELKQKIFDLLGNNQKIEAVKIVREMTNLGLKEAKDIVDALEGSQVSKPPQVNMNDLYQQPYTPSSLGGSEPTMSQNPFDKQPARSGGRVLLLLLAVLIIAGLGLAAFLLARMP